MQTMDMGGGQTMAMPPQWTLGYVGLSFVMWAIDDGGNDAAFRCTYHPARRRAISATQRLGAGVRWVFRIGILSCLVRLLPGATALEWGLDEASLLSETMALGNMLLAGSILVAAGIYQWTPLKDTCLRHCRSPVSFLVQNWREVARLAQFGPASGMASSASGAAGCSWRYCSSVVS